MKGLTEKQLEIKEFIESYSNTRGISPSFREIATHFGIKSLSTIYSHIHALKKKGFLTLKKRSSRSLQLTETKKESELLILPILGSLKSPLSLEPLEQKESITIPRSWVIKPENTLLLKIEDDSFQKERLQAGDILVIEQKKEYALGDTVILTVNSTQEVLIKKLHIEESLCILESVHSHQEPIAMSGDAMTLFGAVKAILRLFD